MSAQAQKAAGATLGPRPPRPRGGKHPPAFRYSMSAQA